ncbi:MAG: DUF1838 family protein [Gammaproteobacteria bacterium]|nr:DUF1838 family protein [Gammaproteobacteria bacterium]
MSSRRDVLAGLAALTAAGGAAPAGAAASDLNLDEPEANLAAYIKLRGDLRPDPVYDMVRGRVFGLVDGQAARPLFKMIGAQRTQYRRVSSLEYRADTRYVGVLLDWNAEQPLQRWINPYNDQPCEVPVTRYGPASMRLLADRMLAGDSVSEPTRATRPWFTIGHVVYMVDQIMSPAPNNVQPDADLMNFSGDGRQLADPALTRIPSQLGFTAVEHWRDWMQMDQPGSLWWHVAGAKLDGPRDYPAEFLSLLQAQDPDFFGAARP